MSLADSASRAGPVDTSYPVLIDHPITYHENLFIIREAAPRALELRAHFYIHTATRCGLSRGCGRVLAVASFDPWWVLRPSSFPTRPLSNALTPRRAYNRKP